MTEQDKMQRDLSDIVTVSSVEPSPLPLIYRPTPDSLPQLNPLYEAALTERLQLDGDIPELRTGPLPESASPAVPVVTTSMNPVVIGEMLERASAYVKSRILRDWAGQFRQMEQELSEPELVSAVDEGELRIETHTQTSSRTLVPARVEGYLLGEVPTPLTLVPISPYEALTLPPERREALAWRFLSTTQGRRSVLGVIRGRVCALLGKAGIEVLVDRGTEPPDFEASWTLVLDSPSSIQPRFPYLETASKSLARQAVGCPRRQGSTRVSLEVRTSDNYAQREMGWRMIWKWS